MLWVRKQNGLVASPKATVENIFTWTGLNSLVSSREHICSTCTSPSRAVGFSGKNPNTAAMRFMRIMRFIHILIGWQCGTWLLGGVTCLMAPQAWGRSCGGAQRGDPR